MRDLILCPAGVIVGIVNAVAGGGSLVSFPLFLVLGYSPLTANVSNSIGVFPSNFGSVWGYRDELIASRQIVIRLSAGVAVGTVFGAVILLSTGEKVFTAVAPWLIVLGTALVVLQPLVVRRLAPRSASRKHSVAAIVASVVVGVYGGYFGPGMGVMLLGVFGMLVPASLQRINAFKNAAAVGNNLICVILFTLLAHIAWGAALSMAVGTGIGGFIGAHIARRLPDRVFRVAIVIVGLAAAVAVALR